MVQARIFDMAKPKLFWYSSARNLMTSEILSQQDFLGGRGGIGQDEVVVVVRVELSDWRSLNSESSVE